MSVKEAEIWNLLCGRVGVSLDIVVELLSHV